MVIMGKLKAEMKEEYLSAEDVIVGELALRAKETEQSRGSLP